MYVPTVPCPPMGASMEATPSGQSYIVIPPGFSATYDPNAPGFSATFDPNVVVSSGYGMQVF